MSFHSPFAEFYPVARNEIRAGKLVIDLLRGSVWYDGYPVPMRQDSLHTLAILARRHGQWIDRPGFLDAIGDEGQIDERSIDGRIKRLRIKLKRVGGHLCLQSKYGLGYRWISE